MGRKTISSRLPYLSAEILSSLDRRTRRSNKVPKVQPIHLWSRQLGGQTTRKPRNSSLPTHNHLLSGFLFLNRWQHCVLGAPRFSTLGLLPRTKYADGNCLLAPQARRRNIGLPCLLTFSSALIPGHGLRTWHDVLCCHKKMHPMQVLG